jgi:hypothetical protein
LPPVRLRLQPFFRPEDVSSDLAYRAGLWDLYAPAAAPADADADAAVVQPDESKTDSSSSSSSSSSSQEASETWLDATRVVGKSATKAAGAPNPAGERRRSHIQAQAAHSICYNIEQQAALEALFVLANLWELYMPGRVDILGSKQAVWHSMSHTDVAAAICVPAMRGWSPAS